MKQRFAQAKRGTRNAEREKRSSDEERHWKSRHLEPEHAGASGTRHRHMMNRRGEAAERFAERRRREDDAPRLRDVIPDLVACRIDIAQRRADVTSVDVSHTRHLVVARAPAMLVIPCADPSCRDGGHDISSALMRGLRDRRLEIRGEDSCDGDIGTAHCGRVLAFTARAEYRESV